jgi:hypothetical protein
MSSYGTRISPSGRIRFRLAKGRLFVKARRQATSFTIALYVVPLLAAAAYGWWSQSSLFGNMVLTAVVATYGAYLMNSSRNATIIQLERDRATIRQSWLFTRSEESVGLRSTQSPAVGLRSEEDGDLYFLQLKGSDTEDVELLAGHSEKDLSWVCSALCECTEGWGPAAPRQCRWPDLLSVPPVDPWWIWLIGAPEKMFIVAINAFLYLPRTRWFDSPTCFAR